MLHDQKWDLDEDGKVIWNVADYIEEHGWTQAAYNRGEAVCILGAYRALGIREIHRSTIRIYSLIKCVEDNMYGIVDYNDTPGRTKDEVIAMLRKAAKLRE